MDKISRTRQLFGLVLGLILGVVLLSPQPVMAQIITLQQQFSFGTIAMRSNGSKERLVLNLNGSYSATSNIIVITAPQRAEFLATGFQPSTALSLSIQPIELSEDGQGTGKKFSVGFVYSPNISTDPTGSVTIFIGGTLETSGDGTPYDDRQYAGTASLIVNY
jgi:hypothetical protein